MKTKDFRSLSPKAQEDLRRKAVNAVLQGRTRQEVGALFGVSGKSVGSWVKKHKEAGAKALKAKKRGRPKGGSLKPWQSAQIARTVIDKHPEQLKLPFYLWTREAVSLLIEKRFGIQISVWTAGRYLARWGFTPQKPVRRAFEQNPEAVKKWLEVDYPSIRKLAKHEKAEIYWGDEMGLRSDHAVGRSFSKKGKTPVIQGTGQRFGCSMISAITNRGRLNFMVFKVRFRHVVFLDFLKRIVKQAKKKVFMIVDGHPVHRSRKVKKWLAKNERSIRLFFLPGYSPELNPDEVLNQDVKSNAVGRCRPRTLIEMISNVRGYLRSRQKHPDIVKKYFHEEHVRYAAIGSI
jgi:transposase